MKQSSGHFSMSYSKFPLCVCVCERFSVMTVKIFCAICVLTMVKFTLKLNPQTCEQGCHKHI